MRLPPLLPLLLCLGLTACDTADDKPDPPGEEPPPGAVEPDVELDGSAYAVVVNQTDAGDPSGLSIFHFDANVALDETDTYAGDLFTVFVGTQSITAPALTVGAYDFGGTTPLIATYGEDLDTAPGDDPDLPYYVREGSVMLDTITDTEVRGSYAFRLVRSLPADTVTVGGDFVAPIVDGVDLSPPEAEGSFTATATGAVSGTVAGIASFFSLDPPDGRTTLEMESASDSADPDTSLFISGIVDAPLALGTYPITGGFPPVGEFGAGFETDNLTDPDDFFRLGETAGTFTVATLTATEATGSFSFTGRTFDAELNDIGETTVTGTFSAPLDP